jgi:hypothetical protein
MEIAACMTYLDGVIPHVFVKGAQKAEAAEA